MHYFQHNIADYRKDTAHLTLLEHGVYRQLLDQYYLNEKPLPLDQDKLMRLLCARSEGEIRAVLSVLGDFFEKTELGYIHKRCDAEIEAFQSKQVKAVAAANKRWNNADAMQTHSEPNANHKPITINHKPITNIKPLSDFDLFWMAYPKKVGKEAARKSWDKVKPDLKTVLETLKWQKQSDQWFKNNGQYIPNPSTYLNQHRFLDQRNDNREAF
jgi:uncharacterized protein YdaU (DUF1376 family)